MPVPRAPLRFASAERAHGQMVPLSVGGSGGGRTAAEFSQSPGLPEARWSEIIFDVWPLRPFLSNLI